MRGEVKPMCWCCYCKKFGEPMKKTAKGYRCSWCESSPEEPKPTPKPVPAPSAEALVGEEELVPKNEIIDDLGEMS